MDTLSLMSLKVKYNNMFDALKSLDDTTCAVIIDAHVMELQQALAKALDEDIKSRKMLEVGA